MIPWAQRSSEERALLNPAFCANLLWHAALGYANVDSEGLSFEESFLVLPFVLHREIREELPRNIRTSLAVWLENHPFARGQISIRAKLLAPFTKEGLLFGGLYGLFQIEKSRVYPNVTQRRTISSSLRESSNEVRECSKKSEFIGKWFAQAGSAPTILAMIGVRP